MRILQTISGLSAKSGGPSTCTLDLMNGLYEVEGDHTVELLTVASPDILGKGSKWLREVDNDYVTPLGLSRNIKRALATSDYDVYHANALWAYSSHITCRLAIEKGKPYVLSPHGMLYPTALAIKRWKKIPMLRIWFRKDIMQATCLHATCHQEAQYCRQFGYKGPIAVIPNAVVFPEFLRDIPSDINLQASQGKKRTIGFLGRLHPIKKVENVLYALYHLKHSQSNLDMSESISFQIMGKYDDTYEQWLKGEVKRLGLEDCVEFVGFVNGKEKYDRLSQLSALMVPSAQENFGMIVPEALICRTPVYASLGTPWSELNSCHCGWWRDNDPLTIAEVIMEILDTPQQLLGMMGVNGRKLMEDKYEQHKVATMMKRLYEWMNDGCKESEKPEFVCC